MLDSAFPSEWQRMKNAGLPRGAYLFLRFPHPKFDRKYGRPADPVTQATLLRRCPWLRFGVSRIKPIGNLDGQ
jgi:hypothetical protein